MRTLHLILLLHMLVSTSMAQSTTQPRNRLLVYRSGGHVVAMVWITDSKFEKCIGTLNPDGESCEEVLEHEYDDSTFRSSLALLKVWQANPSPPPLDVLASAINRTQPTSDANARGSEPDPVTNFTATDRQPEQTAENREHVSLIDFQHRTMAAEEQLLSALTVRRLDLPNPTHQHELNECAFRSQVDFHELAHKHDRLQTE